MSEDCAGSQWWEAGILIHYSYSQTPLKVINWQLKKKAGEECSVMQGHLNPLEYIL